MSELKKREEIAAEARAILRSFAERLEKVTFKEKKQKKSVGGYREEGSARAPESSFREAMFANAPLKSEDFILAEKKKW